MLTAFRAFARSWAAKVLLGLLILSMGAFGLTQYGIDSIGGDVVIKAGSRKLDSIDFKREYDQAKKRFEQQQGGQPITQEIAEENRLDSIVLNGVATREAFAELLSKSGVHPSDKLVLAQLQQDPSFFDPITGKFDDASYRQLLAQNSLRPEDYDATLRDRMAAQNWAVAIQNGLAVPRAYGALAAVYAAETRDLAYFVITPQSVPQPPPPTEAQLQAFVAQNKSRLTVPETRELTVVVFEPGSVGDPGPIDPAELKKRYDFRKDTLSRPETRTLVQIPAKDAAAARTITQRLTAGDAPAAIAKSLGVQTVDYADKPMTAIPDRKAGQAAFKLAAGQVATVQGDLGTSVFKVISITPGREVSMEEARPMLEAEIRKDLVAQKAYARSKDFDDARQGGASLAEAALKAGVPPQKLGPISAQGVDAQGRQLQGNPALAKIIQTAFTLPQGGESETTEIGEGVSFAVRVEKVIPPHVRPMTEIREAVAAQVIRNQIIAAMEAKGQALVARIRKGEPLDAVAASAGYPPVRIAALSRQNAQTQTSAPQEVLGRALGSKPGEVWTTRTAQGLAVGRIDNVAVNPATNTAAMAEQARGQLSGQIFSEMAEAAQNYARARLKVKTDPDRARAAAGFEPLKKDEKKAPEKKG